MKSSRFTGFLLAAMAAAAYGTNPAFAVPLYAGGMNANSVLLFRYIIGLPILAMIMGVRGIPFGISRNTLGLTAILGLLMALSSLTLFESYNYMNSGVASTLLFVYPIMVAVIMVFFFHEKIKTSIYICLVVMTAGLIFLIKPSSGEFFSIFGCLLVFLSALTYALYIVLVNVSPAIKEVPTTKLLFYVLAWGSMLFLVIIVVGVRFTMPVQPIGWLNLVALAIIPTVLSLAFTTRAIQLIGSTPTAILGALEPVTAVVLSVIVLHQGITLNEIIGGCLIIIATTIVISDNAVDKAMLHIRKMFPRHSHKY